MNAKQVFFEALATGREVEFSYHGEQYFLSRNAQNGWYVYHEQSDRKQCFDAPEALLRDATLQAQNINDVWDLIEIAYIL